jgi:hypothetical protein
MKIGPFLYRQQFGTYLYSPGKTQSLCNKIATFAQYPTETFSEAFERFNEYTRAVPHHKFPKDDLVQKFYQGLIMVSRTIIDASTVGSIIELTPTEAFTLSKKVADNDTWALSERLLPFQLTGNVKGVLQVEKENIHEGKIDSLMRRLEKMEIQSFIAFCEYFHFCFDFSFCIY